MAEQTHLLAEVSTTNPDGSKDHGEIYVIYEDSDLQILGVVADFEGSAHMRLGDPGAPRKIQVQIDSPVTVDFSRGRKYYLEDTPDGLELDSSLKMYFEVSLG